MLDERARELSWEAWRRNDLIRFGQFETEYPLPNDVLKIDKSTFRRLYPVPTIFNLPKSKTQRFLDQKR